ncbi:unnamed protein product [Sphenostylis stenocarpa]|uniref:Late embryogenesis abundant protein LEA-2 subgroup domain-containing protein n=1 Tax=Sphenostylis stenocarpa TaxID=92480 RepID=A0AA86SMY4_9FABA|nr:unnamed protein product [Sphenostylis stenocarpa]
MVPSILHGESRVDKTTNPSYNLIPISQDDEDHEISYNCDEFCGTPWRIARTILGLISIVVFLATIFANEYSDTPMTHTTPPRFFLHSFCVDKFNISQGELSATWNVDLNISNGANSSFINFLNLKAFMVFKEDIALAVSTPIQTEDLLDIRGVFFMDKNENKTLHLSFNTTGWERDQPVVDDDVIQEIDREMITGVMSFGLRIEVEAEIEFNMMNLPVFMQPYCPNLEVDFAPLRRGEAATLVAIDEVRECFDNVDQWNIVGY